MSYTPLYYPAINIPNGDWLRKSLLFTENVSSIVPFERIDDDRISYEMKLLQGEGMYEPIYVLDKMQPDSKDFKDFEDGFIETINSPDFEYFRQTGITKDGLVIKHEDYKIYLDKMPNSISEPLKEKGLLTEKRSGQITLDKTTAILYMSLLSDYFAKLEKERLIVPSTDSVEYENLAYKIGNQKKETVQLVFNNCIPTPNPDVKIEDIIRFKKKRKDELKRFSLEMLAMEREIMKCSEEEQLKRLVIGNADKMEQEVKKIEELMRDANFGFGFTGMKSLLDWKIPAFISGTTGIAALATIPYLLTIAGAAACVAIIGTLVATRKSTNRQVSANSFSYLYYAQKDGIITL